MVVVSSFVGMFGNGSISQGFPRFFTPIQTDLGLTSAQMSLVFSLARAEGSAGGPLIGWAVDKFGARPMVLGGGLMVGIGTILLSRADSYWELLVLFSGIISLGKSAGFGQTLMAAVNQWFVRRRSLAMSTLMTAFAGGGAFVVLLLNLGIQQIGWRDTILWTGVFILVMTIPASLFIRSRPEDMGLLPDGDVPDDSASGGSGGRRRSAASEGFTFMEAIKTRTYWLIMVGAILRVSVTNGMLVHVFPIMELRGISANEASAWVAAMFFLGIPLRFVLGVTSDKFRGNVLLAVGMAIGAIGMGGLWIGPGIFGMLLLFVVGIAIVEGITSVNWLMLSDYYGRARFRHADGVYEPVHERGDVHSRRMRFRPGQGRGGKLLLGAGGVHAAVPGERGGVPVRHPAESAGPVAAAVDRHGDARAAAGRQRRLGHAVALCYHCNVTVEASANAGTYIHDAYPVGHPVGGSDFPDESAGR